MVNAVKAPSHNRHFYGGDATSISTIDSTDIITLDTLDMLNAAIAEFDTRLQPVKVPDDPAGEEAPLYVLYMTKRQWHWLQTHTNETTNTGWRTFLAQARERGAKNPLFTGVAGMWGGILVKPMERAIRFHQGSTVTVCTDAADYTTTTQTVPTYDGSAAASTHAVDRAILLGAQALAHAWGADVDTGIPMNWYEGKEDHDNVLVASASAIGGTAKVSFKDTNGVHTDHGVVVLDSYAPDPRTVRL